MAGFGFAGAAGGANDALQQLLTRAFEEEQVRQRQKLAEQELGQRAAAQQANENFQLAQMAQAGEANKLTRMDRADSRAMDFMRFEADEAFRNKQLDQRAKLDATRIEEPFTLSPGAQRFDAAGRVIASVPPTPPAPREPAAPRPQTWVRRGGQVVPIAQGTAQPGDEPYDPVAARQQNGPNPQAEALDTAQEVKRVAEALRQHKGLPGAFGILDSKLLTLRQSTADAEVLRDALISLLTLENTGKLKGVLSNADMKILKEASTTLAAPMSDAAARAELDRLVMVMDKVIAAGGGPVQIRPDGGAAPTQILPEDALLDELLGGK